MTDNKTADTQIYETIQEEQVEANAKQVKKGTATHLQLIVLVLIGLTVVISTTILEMKLANQREVINSRLTDVASLSTVQNTLETRVDSLDPNISKYYI